MGGGIAGLVAARHADVTASLTLMNAAGVRGHGSTPFERGLMIGKNTLVPNTYAEVVRLFATVLERNRTPLSLVLASAMGQEMVSRRHVNRHLFHHMIAHSLHCERVGVSGVTVPTLILWGGAEWRSTGQQEERTEWSEDEHSGPSSCSGLDDV